jgi:hypothetical protein
MPLVSRSLLALACLATPALAAPIEGTWAGSAEACTAGYAEDRLTIAGSSIRFVESSCTLANPTALRDMPQAMLYDIECSGEGMTWSERAFIGSDGEDGLIVYTRGYATQYRRC